MNSSEVTNEVESDYTELRKTATWALLKKKSGYYAPVEILRIDLVENKIRIGWHVNLMYCMKYVDYDRVVPWNEGLVEMPW